VASGVTGASPIWKRITMELFKTTPPLGFTIPSNLIKVNVCSLTGELTCQGCPTKTEYFIPGTEPKKACTPEAITKMLEDKAKKEAEPQIL